MMVTVEEGKVSEDRARLNEALRGMGYDVRGDLVVIRQMRSETREVRCSEKAVVAEISMEIEEGFATDGLRLERFRKNTVVLWSHDYEGLPVARSLWERVRSGDNEDASDILIAKLQFHLDTEVSREAWALIYNEVDIWWELGVVPTEWNFSTTGQVFVTKWDLVEISAAPSEECVEVIHRRIKNRRVSSPAILRSVEGAEPEEPEEETSGECAPKPTTGEGTIGKPYDWEWRYRGPGGLSRPTVAGPGIEKVTETPEDAAALTDELNDAWRRGRESAREEKLDRVWARALPPSCSDTLADRVAELEQWRAAETDKLARIRKEWERDIDADRKWGDGPEKDGGAE